MHYAGKKKMNKKGLIKSSLILILIVTALLFLILIPDSISAGKSDQANIWNYTCENKTETAVYWSAMGTKSAGEIDHFNWTMRDNPCPGGPSNKSCDVYAIYTYTRYLNAGSEPQDLGDALQGGNVTIANNTETDAKTEGTILLRVSLQPERLS